MAESGDAPRIEEYVVMRFSTTETRDDILPSPGLGMTCVIGTSPADAYLCFFNGAEWVRVGTA